MMRRGVGLCLCVGVLAAAVWLGSRPGLADRPATAWTEVSPGVYRSPGQPAGYALVQEDRALLIDAASPPDGLNARRIEGVLLTHHHRDGLAAIDAYLAKRIRVRAPKASAPWLTPDGVAKYWRESLPLRNSRTAYLVLPEGKAGIEASLEDGQSVDWADWSIRAVATPGHSADHVAYFARHKSGGKRLLFAGDALAAPGKMWSPYTTDWDHWTDAGLAPAAESLRKLAALRPDVLLPAHGEVIGRAVKSSDAIRALEKTAAAASEVGFLKSYERYTRERLKDSPKYAFLAKEQAGTNGSKPWSKVAANLWLTGNTYVLASKDGPCLVIDPWDPHSAKQIPKLQNDEKLGKVEVVLCSHAHFDHYDGAYTLLDSDRPQVWTLDAVAGPVADPSWLRAPFLDARPLRVDRRFKEGETGRWREYTFRFHFLPGQTRFTMGVETTLPGLNTVLFTGDNWFHQDLYSGTGGWMGLNRSSPLDYAQSAEKVVRIKPDWVLAEHGGAFEFNAEDFRRRIEWGRAAGKAADALSVSGNHRRDWSPHEVHFEPVLQKAKPAETIKGVLVGHNRLGRREKWAVALLGRGLTPDQTWELEAPGGGVVRRDVTLRLGDKLPAGRHVFALKVTGADGPDPSDAFLAVDVEP